jgi:hypothetical protein
MTPTYVGTDAGTEQDVDRTAITSGAQGPLISQVVAANPNTAVYRRRSGRST